jgi:anti-anti-sigma regulatory factor
MLATERDDSALLPGMFRLAASVLGDPQPTLLAVNGPFALIGRDESCACRLDHTDVSRRHAYLQAVYGRIFCVDLGSRNGTHWGETAQKSGWLDPGARVRIGPYQIQVVDSIGLGAPSAPFPENFSPLDPYAGQFGPLPHVELEIISGTAASTEMPITRLMTLVGSSPRCKLRLQHASVAKVECSLLWLSDGLWVVDLSGRGHARVRGKILRCARLENEQILRLGRFHLRVRYRSSAIAPLAEPEVETVTITGSGWPPQKESSLGNVLEADSLLAADEGAAAPTDAESSNAIPPEDEHAARRGLAARRKAADARERLLASRENKLSEAQMRLASEWEQLHVDRAAYEALFADLVRKQEELAAGVRRLSDEADSLARHRAELGTRTTELNEFQQRLTFEWQRLAGDQPPSPPPVVSTHESPENEPVTAPAPHPVSAESSDQDSDSLDCDVLLVSDEFAPTAARVPTRPEPPRLPGFDVLESVRHNKVFSADRIGATLVVTPLGDASEFHYGDVHVESNKVRRLLEGGTFQHLLVDLGNAPVYSAVTINVVVALSRIASNRGGRAVLCRASEKTRSLLQTMKLLDVWPLFPNREEALRALGSPSEA